MQGWCLVAEAHYQGAIEYFEKGESLVRPMIKDRKNMGALLVMANMLLNHADAYHALGRHAEVIKRATESARLRRHVYNHANPDILPDLAVSKLYIVRALFHLKRSKPANRILDRYEPIFRKGCESGRLVGLADLGSEIAHLKSQFGNG
jgi:hypothetical protein